MRAFAVLLTAAFLLSSCANPKPNQPANELTYACKRITPAVVADNAVYAMMASNSYHKPGRVKFGLDKIGWHIVDMQGNPINGPTKQHIFSGLAYDIYEKSGSNDVAIVFRGTEGVWDYLTANAAIWPFSIQYTQARKEVAAYLKNHPQKNVVVVGHSMGGGLALSMSVHHGLPAIAFNSSPRIFDGLGDHHKAAPRLLIYEEGEMLAKVRRAWPKIWEVVKQEDIYCTVYGFGGSPHRSDGLAKAMLMEGALHNSTLKPIVDALPPEEKTRTLRPSGQ